MAHCLNCGRDIVLGPTPHVCPGRVSPPPPKVKATHVAAGQFYATLAVNLTFLGEDKSMGSCVVTFNAQVIEPGKLVNAIITSVDRIPYDGCEELINAWARDNLGMRPEQSLRRELDTAEGCTTHPLWEKFCRWDSTISANPPNPEDSEDRALFAAFVAGSQTT